jgi:hypothetical protein
MLTIYHNSSYIKEKLYVFRVIFEEWLGINYRTVEASATVLHSFARSHHKLQNNNISISKSITSQVYRKLLTCNRIQITKKG